MFDLAAAQCLTSLYRSGQQASKRAYDAGYVSACEDLLAMIQHGVSSVSGEPSEVGIGKIMDWVEARFEAVKAGQQEEDESEEEREGNKAKTVYISSYRIGIRVLTRFGSHQRLKRGCRMVFLRLPYHRHRHHRIRIRLQQRP